MTALAPVLQAWFTDRLINQRNSSPDTIDAYTQALSMLLRFASEQTSKQPFELDIDDLDAPLIGTFLKHLEEDRGFSELRDRVLNRAIDRRFDDARKRRRVSFCVCVCVCDS